MFKSSRYSLRERLLDSIPIMKIVQNRKIAASLVIIMKGPKNSCCLISYNLRKATVIKSSFEDGRRSPIKILGYLITSTS